MSVCKKCRTFAPANAETPLGEMVEWSITAVLKTAVLRGTGGSNPSLSALRSLLISAGFFDFNLTLKSQRSRKFRLLPLSAAILRKICCVRSLLRLTQCRLLENKFMQCIDIAPARHSSSKLGSALAHSQCSQTSGLMSSDDPNGRPQHWKIAQALLLLKIASKELFQHKIVYHAEK